MQGSRDTVDEFLSRNTISWNRKKSSSTERCIDCPECGKQSHLFVNRGSFLWNCKRCGAKGGESALKRLFGLQYDIEGATGDDHQKAADKRFAIALKNCRPLTEIERWSKALQDDPAAQAARDYLVSRGIDLAIAKRYHIGWSATADGGMSSKPRRRRRVVGPAPAEESTAPATEGWLVIPAFTAWTDDGPDPATASVVKLRSVPPSEKQFRRLIGGTSVLYAPNGVDASQTLVIVGGELDALSVVIAGWPNVVATTTGESTWDDAWTKQLEDVVDVVVIYDNDEAGKLGAAQVAKKLGEHRVRMGKWPGAVNDANEALTTLGEDFDVARIVGQAKAASGDTVVTISSMRDRYKEHLTKAGNGVRGLSTGWVDLDAALGGVRDNEVTLITGDTASGKSTFTAQWALQMATLGVPTLVCPFELGTRRQLDKWVRQWSQAPPDTLDEAKLDDTLDSLSALPIWMLNKYGSIKVEAMRNTLLYAIRRFGIKFIVVDHIHFMVEEGPGERADLDAMMKMLAALAISTDVHIIVVAHPRQAASSDEKNKDNRIIQLSDLKGSSGLKQIADNVLSVWRPRLADRTGVAVDGFGTANVYLLKVRSDYATEGSVNFKYLVAGSRYEAPDASMMDAFKQAMSADEKAGRQQSNATVIREASTRKRRRVGPPTPGGPMNQADALDQHWAETEA